MAGVETNRKNIGDIRLAMSAIRHKGGAVLTNYYNQCRNCEDLLLCWHTEQAIVFQWEEVGVQRVFFYAVDEADLRAALACVPTGGVIDFITKEREQHRDLFLSAGYRLHAEMLRAYQNRDDEVRKKLMQARMTLYDEKYGEMAKESDAEEIDRILRDTFDPRISHLKSVEALREQIKKGWVWIAKEEGKIVALQTFEIQGKKFYGEQVVNLGGPMVMASLGQKLDDYIDGLGLTYRYGWTDLSNKKGLRYGGRLFGGVADGTYDIIYVKERDGLR